jgi:hypothetical protein
LIDVGRGGLMVEYERRIASGEYVVYGNSFSGVALAVGQRLVSWIVSFNAMVKRFPTFLLVHTG